MDKLTKKCSKCCITKPVHDFSNNRAMRDGKQGYCKACQKMAIKIWRENHAAQLKQYDEQYRISHREERRIYNQQWRSENRDYWRNYQNARLHTDVTYRLRNYISREIRRALHKNQQATFDLLGYTVEELRQHLESLFQVGMSWNNYGTAWHIDHVIPQSWFQLVNETGVDMYELKMCWSLSNLQPLWAEENLKKKDRHIHHTRLGQLQLSYEQFRSIIISKKNNLW